MKMLRLLFPVVLLLVALPSFAICGNCDYACNCTWEPGAGTNCRLDKDCCYERPSLCDYSESADTPSLAALYTIAAVDIVAPTDAEVRLAQNAQPAPATKTAIAP